MALMHVQFYSNVLEKAAGMEVLLPEPYKDRPGISSPGYPVRLKSLYLLHGLTNDHTAWQRQSRLERYAAGLPLAVIMPDGGRSFYTDMACGPKYWTFLSQELPRLCEHMFPLSPRREDRFVCGLSMGGYGAVKLGVNRPDLFSYAASLSGALQVERFLEGAGSSVNPELLSIFGSVQDFRHSPNDLFYQAERLAGHDQGQAVPHFYISCGTEDSLLSASRNFRDTFSSLLPITYQEEPGGHDWDFWDRQLKRVLDWLPVKPIKHEGVCGHGEG